MKSQKISNISAKKITAITCALLAWFCFASPSALAYNTGAAAGLGPARIPVTAATENAAQSSYANTDSKGSHTCPDVTDLTKSKLQWVVGTAWASYSNSFSNKALNFVGAQWHGINYGKITCLYHGDATTDFPIALEQTKASLIPEPSGHEWSGLSNNRKICQSANVYDCSFIIKSLNDLEEQQASQAAQASNNHGVLNDSSDDF